MLRCLLRYMMFFSRDRIYISQGVIQGCRLVKNLTPSTTTAIVRRLPLWGKEYEPLNTLFLLVAKGEITICYKNLRESKHSSVEVCPFSRSMGLRLLQVCEACTPRVLSSKWPGMVLPICCAFFLVICSSGCGEERDRPLWLPKVSSSCCATFGFPPSTCQGWWRLVF